MNESPLNDDELREILGLFEDQWRLIRRDPQIMNWLEQTPANGSESGEVKS